MQAGLARDSSCLGAALLRRRRVIWPWPVRLDVTCSGTFDCNREPNYTPLVLESSTRPGRTFSSSSTLEVRHGSSTKGSAGLPSRLHTKGGEASDWQYAPGSS